MIEISGSITFMLRLSVVIAFFSIDISNVSCWFMVNTKYKRVEKGNQPTSTDQPRVAK